MKKTKLKLAGMHCASCANNIERSMKKVAGVKNVSANAITNVCFVESDDSVSEEDMKKAVSRTGYKVVSVEKQ